MLIRRRQLAQYVAPKPGSVQAVTDWLNKNGITATNGTLAGDEMIIEVPVEKANTLLAANFTTFIHTETNTPMVRTLEYSLPASLGEHVSFVYPTTQYVLPHLPIRLAELFLVASCPLHPDQVL